MPASFVLSIDVFPSNGRVCVVLHVCLSKRSQPAFPASMPLAGAWAESRHKLSLNTVMVLYRMTTSLHILPFELD